MVVQVDECGLNFSVTLSYSNLKISSNAVANIGHTYAKVLSETLTTEDNSQLEDLNFLSDRDLSQIMTWN